MAQKFTNGAMDERIVRLNEFKGVKMAQLSNGKRPAAKFNKEVANYLLTNWDDVEALKTCLDAMHKDMPKGCEEVMEIYDKRVKELVAEDKAKKGLNKPADIVEPKFKVGDWVVYCGKTCKITGLHNGIFTITNQDGSYFFNQVESTTEPVFHLWSIEDAKPGDVLADAYGIYIFGEHDYLDKECFVCVGAYQYSEKVYENEHLLCSKINAHPATKEQRDLLFQKMKEKGYEWDEEKKDVKEIAPETEVAAKELINKRKTGAPKTRKVGDHHPTQPWVWKEYKPGKFDWRTDPALKRKPGRKAGETANQSKKKEVAGKAEKAEPAAAPKLTLTELLAKSVPQGLSKPQHSVIKSLKRGFRLRKDGNVLWLTDAAGNNERVEKGVLEALQRRYKIDYIPKDIWCVSSK